MSTTEPIIIPIEGDPSDFVKDSAKVNAELDKMARGTKAASGANTGMASSAKAASFSITDLRSSYMLAMEAARVAGQVWQATGQEFVNYAEQVKNMSRSLGASAEETSRLIQVADDVRVSYDTLKIAMKEAQKDGIDPNIEGLAKLADQYVKLQSPTEKTKFLLDKFGKSGMEMGKLMEKGGDGVRSLSAAIDENMIITEDGIKASDEYQHALDELNDSWSAVKITIGSYLVGPATDLLNHYRDITASLKENGYWYTLIHQFTLDDVAAKREEADAAFAASEGNAELSGALDDSSGAMLDSKEAVKAAQEALKEYKDALEEASQANLDMESMSRTIAEDQKQYTDDHTDAVEKLAEAKYKLAAAEGKLEDQTQAQDLSGAELQELYQNVTDAEQGVRDLEAQWHESANNMIYDMVLVGVSAGGLLDSEQKALDEYAVKAGIKTQADIDEANRRREIADATIAGILQSEDVLAEQRKVDEETLRLQMATTAEEATAASAQQAESMGVVKEAVDSATQSYMAMAQAAWDAAAAAQSAAGSSSSSGSSGGSSPDERDGSSSMSSSSVSKNSTFNISIHNPRGENSANSIRRALKQTSYLGHPI